MGFNVKIHCEINVNLWTHEILWKKNFTVYPSFLRDCVSSEQYTKAYTYSLSSKNGHVVYSFIHPTLFEFSQIFGKKGIKTACFLVIFSKRKISSLILFILNFLLGFLCSLVFLIKKWNLASRKLSSRELSVIVTRIPFLGFNKSHFRFFDLDLNETRRH